MQLESQKIELEPKLTSLEIEPLTNQGVETVLRKIKKRYRSLFEHSNDSIIFCNFKGEIFDANAKALILFGCERVEMVNLPVAMMVPDSEQFYARQAFEKTIKSGHVCFISKIKRVDGTSVDVEINLTLSDPEEGTVQCVLKDIAAQKRAAEVLQKAERELESIIRITPDIIFQLDTNGLITYISNAVKRYGYCPDNLIGRDILDLIHPEDRVKAKQDLFARIAGERKTQELEIRMVVNANAIENVESASKTSYTEKFFLIEAEGIDSSDSDVNTYMGIQAIARDITEYKKANKDKENVESQLLHSQKMEAIGTLAGGIAHDFNNILGAIVGYAQLVEMDSSRSPKTKGFIRQILAASQRAKGLVGQILAFSRQCKIEKIPTNIGPIVKEAMKLLRASLPANIEIRQHVASNLGTIMADQTQIHQVMMNLGTNALHAMKKKRRCARRGFDLFHNYYRRSRCPA